MVPLARTLLVLVVAAAPVAAHAQRGKASPQGVTGHIVYVTQTGMYIDRGTDHGVAIRDPVVMARGRAVVRTQVLAVSDKTAFCAWPKDSSIAPSAAMSSAVRVGSSNPPRVEATPKQRAATPANQVFAVRDETLVQAYTEVSREGFPLVPYRGEPSQPYVVKKKVTAALAHESWGAISGGRGRFEEERFFLGTMLGAPGAFGLDVDLDGGYYTSRPKDARFAAGRSYQLNARRAQVRWVSKDSTLLVGAGRTPARSRADSRPVDGVEIAYRVRPGLNVGAVAGLVPDRELVPNADRAVAGGYVIVQQDFSSTLRGRFDVAPMVNVSSKQNDVGAAEVSTALELESQRRLFLAGRAKLIRDLRKETAKEPIYLGNVSGDLWFAVSSEIKLGGGYRRQDRRAEDLASQLVGVPPGAPAGTAAVVLSQGTDQQIDGQVDLRPGKTLTSSTMAGVSKLAGVKQDGLFAREELTFGPYGDASTRFGVAYLYQSAAFDYHQPEVFVASSPGDNLRLMARYAVLADARADRRLYGHSAYLLAEGRLTPVWSAGGTARYITIAEGPDTVHVFAWIGRDF